MILQGKSAAPGIAVGGIFIYNKKYNIPPETVIKPGQEQSHLDKYVSIKRKALDELERIRLSMLVVDPKKADIFDAQKEIVEDIIINEEIPARIMNERWAGDWAIYQVYETVLGVLRQTSDPLIADRAADFDDVRALLLRLWYGQKASNLSELKDPVIIAARELLPSDTAGLKKDMVLALLTELGGVTSHTAIIAKSFGIPAILGIDGLLGYVKQGQTAAVNAEEGTVILDPEENVTADLISKNGVFRKERKDAEAFLKKEGRTLCGEKIDIGLNISSSNDDELKAANYSDSVGLFRTEFLYMGRSTLPDEEEQFSVYKKVLQAFGDKPVILRSMDIGGDKQVTNLELNREDNPFLGVRGIRLCFSRPEIFKTQVRASLRASLHGNLWFMLPMITSIDDIRRAKEIIEEAKMELKNKKAKFGEPKIGIMIEVPGIAQIASLAAKEIDFASIGSNDLCQYLCAADRTNSEVESYYQPFHPAMLSVIKETINAFSSAAKPLSICGELGSDLKALPVLIGLGLRKFSMGAASIADVKRKVSQITIKQCEELSKKALDLPTAKEIEELL